MARITESEVAALAASLAAAKRVYDTANRESKDANDKMTKAKDTLFDAVFAIHNIPKDHYELIPTKNLVYAQPDGRVLVLQGKAGTAVLKTYSPEQLEYIKKLDDTIAQLQLKKDQVVPVSVETHETRSYSVTWGKGQ